MVNDTGNVERPIVVISGKGTVMLKKINRIQKRSGSSGRSLEMKHAPVPSAVNCPKGTARVMHLTVGERASRKSCSINLDSLSDELFVIFDNQVRHTNLLFPSKLESPVPKHHSQDQPPSPESHATSNGRGKKRSLFVKS